MSTNSPAVSRRDRNRAATRTEIKQTALDLMRERGTTEVRFTDIARVMGLTPPALYRYYADRDELLTEMITDGYQDLAAALAAAGETYAGTRLQAVGFAYRAWALEDPQRFALIFGLPVPGYAAPQEGPTVEAAKRAMANLAAVVGSAAADGTLGHPLITQVAPVLAVELCERKNYPGFVEGEVPDGSASSRPDGATELSQHEIAPATHQAMLTCWAGLHGFTCLEAYGHLDWFSEQAREELFRAQLALAAISMGISTAVADDTTAGPGEPGAVPLSRAEPG
jgi:AcrR family transcriptional regulator